MNITFFGTDYYSSIALENLLGLGIKPDLIVTGNKKASLPFAYNSVAEISKQYSIPSLIISDRNDLNNIITQIDQNKSSLGLSASFGFLIPADVIAAFSLGILNIHPSLLPKLRGATPLQSAILDNLTETGVTLMQIDAKFDTGAIVTQNILPIEPTDRTLELGTKAFKLGIEMFVEVVKKYPTGNWPTTKQDQVSATNSRSLTDLDGKVDLNLPAEELLNLVRAYYPKPIAEVKLSKLISYLEPKAKIANKWENINVKILAAHIENNKLIPDMLQIEGKNPNDFAAFARGYLV